MKNGFYIFISLFAVITLSWGGLVWISQAQLGDLEPYFDETGTARRYPRPATGISEWGKEVYREMGCVSCHTQQVRRVGFGADLERGWGTRQSVARDYIHQDKVLLGSYRYGPDLANVGDRQTERQWFYRHLYNPRSVNQDSTMPAYRFLFEQRKVSGQRSPQALDLPAGSIPDGFEVVPTERAERLVTYLMSLKQGFDFSEAEPAPEESPEAAH